MAKTKIELIKKGLGIEEFVIDFNLQVKKLETASRILGHEIADHMKRTIKTNKKRKGSKDTLENSIEAHNIKNGVGVGKISNLPVYWYVLNYGETVLGNRWIPPANRGHFEGRPPTGGTTLGGNEQWIHTGNRTDFFIKPTKFTPINYIEQMKAWMNTNFRTRINDLSKI